MANKGKLSYMKKEKQIQMVAVGSQQPQLPLPEASHWSWAPSDRNTQEGLGLKFWTLNS